MQQLVLKPIRIGGLSVTRFQYHRAIPRANDGWRARGGARAADRRS
jgi:hypothetical protein